MAHCDDFRETLERWRTQSMLQALNRDELTYYDPSTRWYDTSGCFCAATREQTFLTNEPLIEIIW